MIFTLIDTSVWIEYFSKRPRISDESISFINEIICNGDVVLIEPVRAELLSGHILPQRKDEIVAALDMLDMIDLDWNSRNTWDDIISLADVARNKNLPIPSIIDRMILIAALNANVQIASLDRGLLRFGLEMKINMLKI